MIKGAHIVQDNMNRPIVVLPDYLPEGKTILTLGRNNFDITVNSEVKATINDVSAELIVLLGIQNKVGITVHTEDMGTKLPEKILYVADIKENYK